MKRALIPLSSLLLLSLACSFNYGPLQDHSEFTSARLADDGETLLFAYHRFKYRPASGFAAFPDGGIPKYEIDINFLGLYNRKTQQLDILRREENRVWQPGQGNYTVQDMNGPFALVAQGGQVRGPFAHDVQYLLVDMKRRKVHDIDIKDDLLQFQRDPGVIRLAAPDGTLVFETRSPAENQTPNIHRQSDFVAEIWVRTPAGEYLNVAASNHYHEVKNGEVIYWDPDTRDFFAFALDTRKTRVLSNYKQPPYRDVTEGASLTSDKQQLEYGVKRDGQWVYQPLPLDPTRFK